MFIAYRLLPLAHKFYLNLLNMGHLWFTLGHPITEQTICQYCALYQGCAAYFLEFSLTSWSEFLCHSILGELQLAGY